VLNRAITLDASIYHLHDPELLPIGLKLRKSGKRVIFDAHEDVPKQLLAKPYLGPVRLRLLASIFSRFEHYACSRLTGVITATPSIGEKFQAINERTLVVNNFPLLGELHMDDSWDREKNEVCYVGVISKARGIREIVAAMSEVKSNARLALAGTFSDFALESELKALPGWKKTNALGFVDRNRMRDLLGQSIAGLVTFKPLPNHIDAQPNKMFEYMSAGIPVIASNFPLWREIIEVNDCGICIDPLDPTAIAAAIDRLVANPREAQRMGENGRKAVLDRYNWPVEEEKLLAFYASLLQGPPN
jgi:glycosyltransferase involved in cell wall biosynthesis